MQESWIILITRLPQGKGDGDAQLPSFQLIAAVFGVDILASLFTIFGWLSGAMSGHRQTSVVTVVKVWLFSFGVTVVIACVCEWKHEIGSQRED